ncbi:MAG TPA: cation diffusion facilitator family transporter [Gemmatimonadaceae bacterium]|nr:cation diffusion facilitator family transporter [Gemmatimonadaceae bacterium]
MNSATSRSIRWAQAGLVVNALLVLVKLIAGIVGHANALVADAVESSADIFSSLIVWMGLSIAARPADEDHPYGHGKAEPLAAAVVSLMLLGAAVGISIMAIREILTPHHLPAPFTLFVAAGVIIIKEILYRRVSRVGREVRSTVIAADAWHHRADAVSSLAAFVGISIALWGGRGWEAADDWAALVAAILVAVNGVRTLRPAISGLMDEAPDRTVKERALRAALTVDGVRHVENLNVRGSGLGFHVDLHAQADPAMPLEDAHEIAARVKYSILDAIPNVVSVLVHMEPYRDSEKIARDPVYSLPPV